MNDHDSELPTNIIPLRGEHITLAQAMKAAGIAGTGGQAKLMIREGEVTVNGVDEIRPGRKLLAGDRFEVGDDAWTIGADAGDETE